MDEIRTVVTTFNSIHTGEDTTVSDRHRKPEACHPKKRRLGTGSAPGHLVAELQRFESYLWSGKWLTSGNYLNLGCWHFSFSNTDQPKRKISARDFSREAVFKPIIWTLFDIESKCRLKSGKFDPVPGPTNRSHPDWLYLQGMARDDLRNRQLHASCGLRMWKEILSAVSEQRYF